MNTNKTIIKNEDKNEVKTDYITWNEYFMSICLLSSKRSKDPVTKVGACIIDENNHIISIGYNGFPNGCNDNFLPWSKNNSNYLDNKYPFVVHSEVNAIINVNSKIPKKCKMYVSLFPCNECAKLIIQSGIKNIIYYDNKNYNSESCIASRIMFNLSGVKYTQYTQYTQYTNKIKNIVLFNI